jgi:nucleoside-triphosphatase THEP1
MSLVIVTGGKGDGKTTACAALLAKCREMGVSVGGILSPRRFEGGRHIGYDCLDCRHMELFPLARVRGHASGGHWLAFGRLGYLFSRAGLDRANRILVSASGMASRGVAFIDEVGTLEMGEKGLYDGLMALLDRPDPGLVVVASCRLGADAWLSDLAASRSFDVKRLEAGDTDRLLDHVRDLLPT